MAYDSCIQVLCHLKTGPFAVRVFRLNDQHGWLDEVEKVPIPQIRLDNLPLSDQLAGHQGGHVAAGSSSLGSRTRL